MAEPTTATASHPPGPQTTQSATGTRNHENPTESIAHPQSTADNTTRNAGINNPPTSASEANANKKSGDDEVSIGPDDEITPEQAEKAGLPEQKHAGAVGYGPEYANQTRATTGEKLQGFKEQIKGKLKKDPELVKHGQELRTGELKRRQHEAQEEEPLKPAAEEKNKPATNSQPSTTGTDSAPSKAHDKPSANGAAHDSGVVSPGTKNTPDPYPAKEGLNGGKSDEVDLNQGSARLTQGHGGETGYKTDGGIVQGNRADQETVRAAEV